MDRSKAELQNDGMQTSGIDVFVWYKYNMYHVYLCNTYINT